MYAQAAIKPNTLLRNGAYSIVMTDAMDDYNTEEERNNVKKNQIYGIEYEDGAYGLSSTNILRQ